MRRHEIRRGSYFDSVILMQLQRSLAEEEGVREAGAVMATEANRRLLQSRELLPDHPDLSDQDLLIVVRAEDEVVADRALASVDDLLARKPRDVAGSAFRPKTLAAAVDQLPHANWVCISVPGRYAAAVAQEALDLERHVFLFSDNVTLEDELALKERAAGVGRLMMGPDCGTALLAGVGFGFANRVRSGAIGIVAASGTGLQSVSSHLHELGAGVSHAIGTGGRDLSDSVGAFTARQGLEALARDGATKVIVLISKRPSPQVVPVVLRAALAVGKPTVVAFQGWPAPAASLGPLHFARDFAEAAQLAVNLIEGSRRSGEAVFGGLTQGRHVRGLFSGGTLAGQLFEGLKPLLPSLRSNLASAPDHQPEDLFASDGHVILDLGADEFTAGRLHPMIDNELRLTRLESEGGDSRAGLVVLDIVLGEGAHPNPAAEFARPIAELTSGNDLDVAVVLVGTDEDRQNVGEQRAILEQAGARLYRAVCPLLNDIAYSLPIGPAGVGEPIPLAHLQQKPAVINIGLELFARSLADQGVEVLSLDWRPPARGDEQMMDLLARMKE